MAQDTYGVLESVVWRAGEYVRSHASSVAVVPGTPPGTEHPTTDLDRSTDDLLCKGLMSSFPESADVAYLTEERADDPGRLKVRRLFIVDPIDGTRSLLKGLPEAAVSVALWQEGALEWGCVYNPFTEERFTARRGRGGLCNGVAMTVSGAVTLASARLVLSRSEQERGMLRQLEGRVEFAPLGSIAYKMALIAAGCFDGTFTPHVRHEWDIAGAAIMVEEAGGRVTDAKGDPIRFNSPDLALDGLVVSNGPLHDQLLELVGEVL